MPPRLKRASGKISVVAKPCRAAICSRPEPGLAALAAYLGHLYPPACLYGETLPRGRGNLVLVGTLAALTVIAAVMIIVADTHGTMVHRDYAPSVATDFARLASYLHASAGLDERSRTAVVVPP